MCHKETFLANVSAVELVSAVHATAIEVGPLRHFRRHVNRPAMFAMHAADTRHPHIGCIGAGQNLL